MDSDGHLTVYRNRTILFEGSYEAFCAEAGIDFEAPPRAVINAIHAKAERCSGICPDCGASGERKGHMGCQYPND